MRSVFDEAARVSGVCFPCFNKIARFIYNSRTRNKWQETAGLHYCGHLYADTLRHEWGSRHYHSTSLQFKKKKYRQKKNTTKVPLPGAEHSMWHRLPPLFFILLQFCLCIMDLFRAMLVWKVGRSASKPPVHHLTSHNRQIQIPLQEICSNLVFYFYFS